ncbi:MAG: hypothetical protein ACYS5V_06155, partial [Planctomycetota bacterium]
MKQPTHAWIAVRAIALLDDEKDEKNLVKLLRPHARKAAIGSWIPDLGAAKRGTGKIQNHVFKIMPYKGDDADRFTADKAKLCKRLGSRRMMSEYLRDSDVLDDDWWSGAYKASPPPGKHLANCAMAMSTAMLDLLLLGESSVDRLLPGAVSFLKHLDREARTREEQAALHFFMLSHFIADACMPCHCDGRKLAGFDMGLHQEWEAHWSRNVGRNFKKKQIRQARMSGEQILAQAREVDTAFDLDFGDNSVPALKKGRDVWLEMVDVCRASFAIASIVAPEDE